MAMAVNWKKRAEGMLSQYMEGSAANDGDNYYDAPTTSFLHENFSTPNNPTSCADSVYDRLLGCNCPQGVYALDGSCGSLFMQWVKLSIGRTVKAYLSNPIFLALLPIALGVAIGYYFGSRNSAKRKHSNFLVLYKKISWECLRQMSKLSGGKRIAQFPAKNGFTGSKRESGIELNCVPRHIAVIMDGNRRYGREKYGSVERGHSDGGTRLLEFAKWCVDEEIKTLTVYAFSTENWNRDAEEISALKSIFLSHCDKLLQFATEVGGRINLLATDRKQIDADLRAKFERLQNETKHGTNFTLNICLSYSGRNEIVNACKSIATDVQAGKIVIDEISQDALQKKMLTNCCDPDIIIRTSGEERISNFLLWQCAYSEFFFLEKRWPELAKSDLLDVIRTFANERKRRFGK